VTAYQHDKGSPQFALSRKARLLASLAGVQYGLAIHYDAATEQTLSAPREVAVATFSRHGLERIIDQISGDLLTHVIAHLQ
jgi:hypothetical protein